MSSGPWEILCKTYFGTAPALARELWRAYAMVWPQKALSVQYAMDRLAIDAPLTVTRQKLDNASRLLKPADLLQASLVLSPEGVRRRVDVLQFEKSLLAFVDKNGGWL